MAGSSSSARDRRLPRGWIATGIAVMVVAAAAYIPSPYAIERPGPVVNAFGAIETEDGEVPVVQIDGIDTYEPSGELNILSVSISGTPERPASWLALVGGLLDQTRSVVPIATLFPEGISSEERTAANEALMQLSQVQATAAALNELGEAPPSELRVVSIVAEGPADGALREDDVIVTAAGSPVRNLDELRASLAAVGEDGQVLLGVERDGRVLDIPLSPRRESAESQPLLGISVATEFTFPFDITIQLDRIGGPSAGLVFSLAVYDMLTPGELTDGLNVSATGTIDEFGAVGGIGGVQQKIWGAARAGSDLFILPVENCADLPDRVPDDMEVVAVSSLSEAIAAIEAVSDGAPHTVTDRCGDG